LYSHLRFVIAAALIAFGSVIAVGVPALLLAVDRPLLAQTDVSEPPATSSCAQQGWLHFDRNCSQRGLPWATARGTANAGPVEAPLEPAGEQPLTEGRQAATAPEPSAPQFSMRQLSEPQLFAPQISVPQSFTSRDTAAREVPPQESATNDAAPRIAAAKDTAPQVTAPQVQVTTPQVTAPQAAVPQVTAPQVTAPQVAAPQVAAPQVAAPPVAAPQAKAAGVAAPVEAARQELATRESALQEAGPGQPVEQSEVTRPVRTRSVRRTPAEDRHVAQSPAAAQTRAPLAKRVARGDRTAKRPTSEALNAVRKFDDARPEIPANSYAADGTPRRIVIRPTSIQDVYYYSAPR
jgi:hypothetical protein